MAAYGTAFSFPLSPVARATFTSTHGLANKPTASKLPMIGSTVAENGRMNEKDFENTSLYQVRWRVNTY